MIEKDGIVVIENPVTAQNLPALKAVQEIPNLRRIFEKNDLFCMNKNHHYFYQCQGALHVTQKMYCIFALCTATGNPHYIRINHDDKFWNEKIAAPLQEFYYNWLLPEILDPRRERNMELREPDTVKAARKNKKEGEIQHPYQVGEEKEITKEVMAQSLETEKTAINTVEVTNTNSDIIETETVNAISVSRNCVAPVKRSLTENIEGLRAIKLIRMNEKNNEVTVAEKRQLLQIAINDINMVEVMNNILNTKNYLTDESIQVFLNIVQEANVNGCMIHPVIYYRYPEPLPKKY